MPETESTDCKIASAYRCFQEERYADAEARCEGILARQPDQAAALYLLGAVAQQAKKLDRAAVLFEQAAGVDPRNPVYHLSLAEVHQEKGDIEKAAASCRRALALRPDMAQAHFHLAVLYHRRGSFDEAMVLFQQAAAIDPSMAEAHYNLGNIRLDRREYERAEDCYLRALAANPEAVDAHFNLGIAQMEQKKLPEAVASFESALRFAPDMAAAHYNLGCVFHKQGRFADAIGCFRCALALKPDFAEAANNLGSAYLEKNQPTEAAAAFEKAIAVKPDYADAHYNLGKVRQEQGESDAALRFYRAALSLDPSHCKACNNTAKIHQDRGQLDLAAEWYRKAVIIRPDYAEARFNLATVQLLRGQFSEGWEGYEWRFRRRHWQQTYPFRFSKPRWEGDPFPGKTVYVHSEQGMGDILQFVRYLPLVKARGGRVIFETISPMTALCKRMTAIDHVLAPPPGGKHQIDFDYYIPLLSLPRVFQTELDSIPNQVPYLHADPADVRRWQPRIRSDGLRIGLVWAGTATDPRRACPLGWFTPLTRIKDVHFYGLQKGISAEQIEVEGLPKGMRLINLGQAFQDFADTAAVVELLDLVISIDTSVAHLAGAMGKPVWILLPAVPDWRWLLDRGDSPWYPTARLFRQRQSGDWQPVIQELADELIARIRAAA